MDNIREILNEVDEKILFVPDIEWMKVNYDKMNNLLFDNKLGSCEFKIFTTGNGANGRVLGWFRVTGKNLKYNRKSRLMYYTGIWGDKEYIDYENFCKLCKPCIELNGNYRWTERAALSTLIHEMCHYYTYMYGKVPTQAHGREFRNIAAYVSAKSNDFFTVERIASAEQMGEMELDSVIAAKNQQRRENKENRIILMFLFMQNGEIRLINANSMKLVDFIIYNYKNDKYKGSEKIKEIKISTDEKLKRIIFDEGYKKACTTYRYWNVEREPFIKDLDNYKVQTVLSTVSTLPSVASIQTKPTESPQNSIISHFKFSTIQGNTFEVRNVTKDELKAKLKERFPKWSDSAIERVINTEKYYL